MSLVLNKISCGYLHQKGKDCTECSDAMSTTAIRQDAHTRLTVLGWNVNPGCLERERVIRANNWKYVLYDRHVLYPSISTMSISL